MIPLRLFPSAGPVPSKRHESTLGTPMPDMGRGTDVGTVSSAGSHSSEAKGTLVGLDWVRAFAAVGVVLLHASVPYLRYPMPGLAWAIHDSPSEVVDLLFWSVEIFIMPVFLVIAGFLLGPTIVRRGPGAAMKSRLNRLGRPLLFGAIVILPIDLYLWLAGWVSEGIIPITKIRSLKFDGVVDRDLWGLSHLWFLLYTMIYVCFIAAGVWIGARSLRIQTLLRKLGQPRIGLSLLFGIAIATLCWAPEVVWGFQHRFAPVPSKWIYSFTFFLAGYLWYRCDPSLDRVASLAQPRLACLGCAALAAAVLMGRWYLSTLAEPEPETAGSETALVAENWLTRIVLASTTVLAAWSVTLLVIAFASRNVVRLTKPVAYLAAASFWIYLVHHPLLALIQIDLRWQLAGVPSGLKMCAALLGSLSLSLVSYEVFIRRSRLGAWTGLGEGVGSKVVSERVLPLDRPVLVDSAGDSAENDSSVSEPIRRAA